MFWWKWIWWKEIDVINKIFEATGKAKKVDEKLMNSVVCASGSSPAYVFMFIEALADSAVKCGIAIERMLMNLSHRQF